MDLLGGYASDEERGKAEDKSGPSSMTHTATGQAAGPLEDKLPAPRKKVKKIIGFRPPINVAPESSDEEERPKKKTRLTSKGMSIKSFLPPPQHSEETSTTAILGGGYTETGSKRNVREDSDDEMAGPDPYRSEIVLGEGNEAYRVYDQLGDVPTAGVGLDRGNGEWTQSVHAETSNYAAPAIGDQMLQQALLEESAKAAKNGLMVDPYAGVQFKEINQQKLTYMPPEQREAKNAVRTAFGADYEQRIREEAGDEPDKKAKRKHQIHSLFHQAKMKELETMELRGQAVKTKRETQAKYGWS